MGRHSPDGTKASHSDYLHIQEINHARQQICIGHCCPFGYIPGFRTRSRWWRRRRRGRVKRNRWVLHEWYRGFNRTLRRSRCNAVKSKLLRSDRTSCEIRNQSQPELIADVGRKYRCSQRRRNGTKRRTDRQPRIRPGLTRAALVGQRLYLKGNAAPPDFIINNAPASSLTGGFRY